MMVVGLVAAFIVIILIDLPTLVKANDRMKTIIIYAILTIMGFIISLLLVIGKRPVSPAVIIEKIVRIFID